MQNLAISSFFSSLANAFGSKKNFEQELIHSAYKNQNKGVIYLCLNNYLNFSIKTENTSSEYPLLACNLDICDIYNFIEDIDYSKLATAYCEVKKLIQTK